MDFFEHQQRARTKTVRLVALFAGAVVLIVLALYALGLLVVGFVGYEDGLDPVASAATGGGSAGGVSWWSPGAAAFAFLLAGVIIGGGTLYKLAQLRAGGRVIAEELGGRMLVHGAGDAVERRLMNIVEEMAIASGTPVPPVYIMDQEPGINAFAAGYRAEDAVIGVTRGAAERLDRDQLQGVIAHEFSHILSGDMRLNLRLIGVLHGILLLGLTGSMILRSLRFAAFSSRSNRNGGAVIFAIVLVGAALALIGSIGTFFGSWIKAAVSRQREYLADASAVQFTRNPGGIAGALRAIGGGARRGRIDSPHAPEASHMFFAMAMSGGLAGLFSTHPPLEKRIRRIDPNWDGTYLDTKGGATAAREPRREARRAAPTPGRAAMTSGFDAGPAAPGPITPGAAVNAVGGLSPAHLERARALIDRIPPAVRGSAQDPLGALAVILALLLDQRPDLRRSQLEVVSAQDRALAGEVARLGARVLTLAPELRLPLLEIAMQPLGSLSPGQADRFGTLVVTLIRADQRVELFEWVLHRLVTRRLLGAATGRGGGALPLGNACSALLTALALNGSPDESAAKSAFSAGAGVLTGAVVVWSPAKAGLGDLGRALDRLEAAGPRVQKSVVEACAAVILHDRVVTAKEAELFRVVAESLGVPVPPLVAGS
jgi:Zn-dependent protease with chaperone function